MLTLGTKKIMNLDLGQMQDLTSYRKIAIASWRHPRDPSTYAMLDLPVEPALAYLDACSSKTPLTLTHYVTKISPLITAMLMEHMARTSYDASRRCSLIP
jgi:hypothetical protein